MHLGGVTAHPAGERTVQQARNLRTAIRAPRRHATGERLARTPRRELSGRVLIPGEARLRAALIEYQVRYNSAWPTVTDLDTQPIRRKPVLNGLINEYTHAA